LRYATDVKVVQVTMRGTCQSWSSQTSNSTTAVPFKPSCYSRHSTSSLCAS
jgi:hypothetical protein